jgi:metal-responsive CopG/Arc/MetJ family transcriptional regulator
MYEITVTIPDPFLQSLDELVQQANAGTREQFVQNLVRNVVFDYQMRKEMMPQQQQRMFQLMNMWP